MIIMAADLTDIRRPQDASAKTASGKARKAAAQFEAVLLNNVLGGVEHAFTQLPGGRKDHSNEAYSGLAMQALTSAVAERGGIGLGTLISDALSKRQVKASER